MPAPMSITKYTTHLHGYMHIPEHNLIMQVLSTRNPGLIHDKKNTAYVKMQLSVILI